MVFADECYSEVYFDEARPPLGALAAAHALGASALDAPVSGGDVGARNAALSIMVGGDESCFSRAKPLLEKLGKTIVHQGAAGSGQRTKIVNQILVAANTLLLDLRPNTPADLQLADLNRVFAVTRRKTPRRHPIYWASIIAPGAESSMDNSRKFAKRWKVR
jgi:6-phosphogluconate dehydrogenase (decarboxylating)